MALGEDGGEGVGGVGGDAEELDEHVGGDGEIAEGDERDEPEDAGGERLFFPCEPREERDEAPVGVEERGDHPRVAHGGTVNKGTERLVEAGPRCDAEHRHEDDEEEAAEKDDHGTERCRRGRGGRHGRAFAAGREVVRAGVERVDDGDVAQGEGGFAVGEVVAPLADEAVVEAEGPDLVGCGGGSSRARGGACARSRGRSRPLAGGRSRRSRERRSLTRLSESRSEPGKMCFWMKSTPVRKCVVAAIRAR